MGNNLEGIVQLDCSRARERSTSEYTTRLVPRYRTHPGPDQEDSESSRPRRFFPRDRSAHYILDKKTAGDITPVETRD